MSVPSLARFKVCGKCGCTKPASREWFQFKDKAAGRLSNDCKVCVSIQRRAEYAQNPHKIRERNKAYQAANKQRKSEYDRRRYEERKAEILAQNKQWRINNAEAWAASRRRYYEENMEATRAYDRERYARDCEAVKERVRQWSVANPERVREHGRVGSHTRRARKKGNGGKHTPEEIWQMAEDQDWLCAYCETPLFGDFTVDHMVPVSRGGRNDWTNLAISCGPCNFQKHTKTAEEFWEVLEARKAG